MNVMCKMSGNVKFACLSETVVRNCLITDILIVWNKIPETVGSDPLTGKSVSR
jgi:hypothetical protein